MEKSTEFENETKKLKDQTRINEINNAIIQKQINTETNDVKKSQLQADFDQKKLIDATQLEKNTISLDNKFNSTYWTCRPKNKDLESKYFTSVDGGIHSPLLALEQCKLQNPGLDFYDALQTRGSGLNDSPSIAHYHRRIFVNSKGDGSQSYIMDEKQPNEYSLVPFDTILIKLIYQVEDIGEPTH